MFAVNLRSFIYSDLFKLTKNVYFSVPRSSLVERIPARNFSHRHFTVKLSGNAIQKGIISSVIGNNIHRQMATTKPPRTSPIKWKSVAIVAACGGVFLLYFDYLKNKKLQKREAERNRQLGKAKLGGNFDLVDQDNNRVTSEDLQGNWLLIYFGFTHCPDICPEELEKMVEVIDEIDNRDNMEKVKPVFITVDPERDTPSVVKKYLKEFSDKIIGLTGTVEQIKAVCKAYRVYFSPGPKDSDADYIVDHSIIMYLVDPQGKFIDYYGQNRNAKDIVTSIHFNQVKQRVQKSTFKKVVDYFLSE